MQFSSGGKLYRPSATQKSARPYDDNARHHQVNKKIPEKKDKLKIESMPELQPALEGRLDASGKRFAIVVSRFNSFITERLLFAAKDPCMWLGNA